MRVQVVNTDQGNYESTRPCLYLSQSGNRCSRPAVEDGFCRVHHPELGHPAWIDWLRKAGAAALLAAALWPIVADVIRELLHLLR